MRETLLKRSCTTAAQRFSSNVPEGELLLFGCRNNPRLGASNTPFTRWIEAEYDDNISQPKGFNNRPFNNFLLPLVRPIKAELVTMVTWLKIPR